jgi:hypothetical protein
MSNLEQAKANCASSTFDFTLPLRPIDLSKERHSAIPFGRGNEPFDEDGNPWDVDRGAEAARVRRLTPDRNRSLGIEGVGA